MRRALVVVLMLVLAAPAFAAPHKAPVAIGIAQREFHITAYRKTVKPGPIRLNVQNYGEDTHNLVVRGPHGYLLQGPDVLPGQHDTINAKLLRRGTYMLICTRANHEQLGMKTKITVRR
jgi:plastocyanin